MKRRQFIGRLSAISLTSLIPSFLFAKDKKAAAPADLIKLDNPLAKAMQYKHDAAKAPVRSDKKAFCYNCAKYNVCNSTDKACKPKGKDAEYAPCSIFPKKLVAKNGWCLSWQKKA